MKNLTHQNKLLLFVPAISIFLITLIPTLNHSWPMSWDVIYHVLYAQVYTQYGFVLINPLLNSPIGQKIAYPPLFHFLIVGLGMLFQRDYMVIARSLQPFLAFFVVLSVTYVGNKFYGTLAGLSAGFLMISSYIIFRIMLPVPENLALIFIPLAVYFFFASVKEKKLKYAFLSGILLLLIAGTHQAALLCLVLVISALTLVELLLYRNFSVLKNYGTFLFSLIAILILFLGVILIFKPDLLNSVFNQGITAALGYSTSLTYTQPLGVFKYLQNFGLLVTGFAVVGTFFAVKTRGKKEIYLFTWIIVLLLLSQAYLFGINVLSPRVLIYILIPLSILAGFGVKQTYHRLKDHERYSSDTFRSAFLIVLFVLSIFFGVLTVENPNMGVFSAKTEFGYVQIAPPSSSEVDISNWFKLNGDKNKSITISNLYTGVLIATETGMPINYEFDSINNETPRSYFENNNIGYIVYDKRLALPKENETLYRWESSSEMFSLFYFNKILFESLYALKPEFAVVVYENNDFIVCEIIK